MNDNTSKTSKITAAVYVRVSTEEQATDGLSIAAQIQTLRQYCQAFDISIYKIYEDAGFSGKDTAGRPALKSLISDSYKALFNQVLVWKISRLSRSLKDLLYLLDTFEKNNVIFSSFSEKFDTSTPVGRMTLQLLGSIAEFERNTIVENVKLGLFEYARQGGKTGSVLGYKNDGKRLVIVPEEAEAVKRIFELYSSEEMSLRSIAEYMNSNCYRTKHGKLFRSDSISLILGNPVYIGINRHQIDSEAEYTVKGKQTPIISEQLWSAVQEKRNRNEHRNNRVAQNTAILAGIIQCPYCRSLMKPYYSYAGSKRYSYYKCSSHPGKAFSFGMEKADTYALECLEALLGDPIVKSDIVKAFGHALKHTAANRNTAAIALKEEKEHIESLLKRYLSLMEKELIINSNTVNDRIIDLSRKIADLEIKLRTSCNNEAAATVEAQHTIEEILEGFTEYMFEYKDKLNELLSLLFKSIIPDQNKKNVNIHFNFPIKIT